MAKAARTPKSLDTKKPPHAGSGMDKCTPEAKARFVAALEEFGTVGAACQAIGIHRSTARIWRNDDPAFAEAWRNALEVADEDLADLAENSLKAQVRKQNIVATIFTLKNRRSERWADRIETSSKVSIEVRHTQEERHSRMREIATALGGPRALAELGLPQVDVIDVEAVEVDRHAAKNEG